MTRHGLRIMPGYPWDKYVGDVITFGNSSAAQVEQIRQQMTTGKWHEVVQLDDEGNVIDRYDCGHVERTKDCGGCDPGAIEFIKEDNGPWRKVKR